VVDTLEVVLAVNGKEIDRIRIVRIRGEEGERCEYKVSGLDYTITHNTKAGARALAAKALRKKIKKAVEG